MNYARGGGTITDIDIATNGTILPNDELASIIKSNGVNVRISDYNITPHKTRQLVSFLQEHEIQYRMYLFAGENGRWFNCGGVNTGDYDTVDSRALRRRYESCAFKGCLTLERGQLARCSRGNNAPEIQGFSAGDEDYLVLGDYGNASERRKALMRYCCFPRYMEACRYCNGTDTSNMVDAAIQI